MANIRNLKKDLNYILFDIIEECIVWEIENPSGDITKSQAIIDEAIEAFDVLIEKINQRGVENRKEHFRKIIAELETQSSALFQKIESL